VISYSWLYISTTKYADKSAAFLSGSYILPPTSIEIIIIDIVKYFDQLWRGNTAARIQRKLMEAELAELKRELLLYKNKNNNNTSH
jgi:hypothetical protein